MQLATFSFHFFFFHIFTHMYIYICVEFIIVIKEFKNAIQFTTAPLFLKINFDLSRKNFTKIEKYE